MDTSLSAICKPEHFHKIYGDLMQLGTLNHERIIIQSEEELPFPVTAKKDLFGSNILNEKTSRFVIEFLERHLDLLAKEEQPESLFSKLHSCIPTKHQEQINIVLHKLFSQIEKKKYLEEHQQEIQQDKQQLEHWKAQQRKEIETEAKKIETEKRNEIEAWALKFEAEKMQEIEARVQVAEVLLQETEMQRIKIEASTMKFETEKMQDIQASANTAEACLQQTEVVITQMQTLLDNLKKEYLELNDTLMVCKDGSRMAPMKLLEKVMFFKVAKCRSDNDMKKTALIPEEQKNCKYRFEFENFRFKVVDLFVRELELPEVLDEKHNFEDLVELYLLADYMNDLQLSSRYLAPIQKQLNIEKALFLLSRLEHSINNELIRFCLDTVIIQFHQVKHYPIFAQMKPEYLMAIMSNNLLRETQELTIFTNLMEWAKFQASCKNVPVKEILQDKSLGQPIISCIRFENFTKEQFVTQALPLDVLSQDQLIRYQSLFLQNTQVPNPRFYQLECHPKGTRKMSLSWNLPAKVLEEIGIWDNQEKKVEIFFWNNLKWLFEIAKQTQGKIIFGLNVCNTKVKFEFFMEIGQLFVYSSELNQENIQRFGNNGKSTDKYVKGACFKPELVNSMIDPVTQSLPIKIKIYITD